MVEFFLQSRKSFHVVMVNTHISSQDRADEQLPELRFFESSRPITTQYLREGSAVEGFQDRIIIVELRQGRVEFN